MKATASLRIWTGSTEPALVNKHEIPKPHMLAIADFIVLPYFSGFISGLKSHVLISHDFLSQSKFVPLPKDQQPCVPGQHKNTKRNYVL